MVFTCVRPKWFPCFWICEIYLCRCVSWGKLLKIPAPRRPIRFASFDGPAACALRWSTRSPHFRILHNRVWMQNKAKQKLDDIVAARDTHMGHNSSRTESMEVFCRCFNWKMVYWWIRDRVKNRTKLAFCSHQFWRVVVHRPIASSQFLHFRPLNFSCRQNMHREWFVCCCTVVVRLRLICRSSANLRVMHKLSSRCCNRIRKKTKQIEIAKPMIFNGVLFRFTGKLCNSKQCFIICPAPLSCWFSSGTKCFHSYAIVDLVRTRDVRWARNFWKMRPPLYVVMPFDRNSYNLQITINAINSNPQPVSTPTHRH